MIYPIIQNNQLTGESVSPVGVNISPDTYAFAGEVLKQYNISPEGDYSLKLVLRDFENSDVEERYFLTVTSAESVIESSSEKGLFRGLHTFLKLLAKGELKEGFCEDYPLFKKRGYIEGFYGATWEQEKRISVMELMAKYGMNTFYYGPKDDLYHREKWRELYPEKELSHLKLLFETAKKNFLEFYWTIGPGLTYKYSSKEDFDLLMEKIKSIYDIGVRDFGLLLDDIPWEFQYDEDEKTYNSVVDAHIELVNKTYGALKSLDNSITLTVCPTQYSGNPEGDYIKAFGKGIPEDVEMFWTGQEICSRVLTVRECDELFDSCSHRPLFWDNYPVNDCEMFQEMHLRPIIGRDKELYKACDGLISNVMEFALCSKIPLMTIADYLWNPVAYNPDLSFINAQQELLGDDWEKFSLFSDHLGVSCLTRYTSPYMGAVLTKIASLNNTGKHSLAMAEFSEYLKKMHSCLELISDQTNPLFRELSKWVEKFRMCCGVLDGVYTLWASPTAEKVETLHKLIEDYNGDAVMLTGFCLREMAEKSVAEFSKILKEDN